jgi:hypothetical protein
MRNASEPSQFNRIGRHFDSLLNPEGARSRVRFIDGRLLFMAYSATAINVMIASPSDVSQERVIVRDVIAEWNAVNSADRRVILMPVGWETHSVPSAGDRPQAIINGQLLKDTDLLIAVFWTRIGSPTGAAPSGTVEEIEEHIRADKPVMIYFSSAPVRLDSTDSHQYEALKKFRQSIQARSLCDSYESLAEFR